MTYKLKYPLFIFALLFSGWAEAQPCPLLTQTFAIADTLQKESGELYVFRFSTKQLDDLIQLPGLEKAIPAIKKLQKTLDEDYDSYKKGVLWQLDEKLAEKHLAELRKECPETGFMVFEKEIRYYKLKYQEKGAEKK